MLYHLMCNIRCFQYNITAFSPNLWYYLCPKFYFNISFKHIIYHYFCFRQSHLLEALKVKKKWILCFPSFILYPGFILFLSMSTFLSGFIFFLPKEFFLIPLVLQVYLDINYLCVCVWERDRERASRYFSFALEDILEYRILYRHFFFFQDFKYDNLLCSVLYDFK